ncbi:sulfatase family protein [Pelagibacterium limicola]|uniref:sulfatase family protein n=1 Tax=Pelagibacterium limicola TaxID=2791022 RepID=UPI0018AF9975|nr:sulfatase [Pelagibacterium limicola]
MTVRPNILCIVSEDCPPRLGAYGDNLARSPNLDALAKSGVVFENANSTSPVCAPSRFAILTGRHAESCPRAQHMQTVAPLPPGFRTCPDMMRAAGYYCTNNFKTHYNCDVKASEIWDESSKTAHWRNRPGTQPFYAVFNSMATHESCTFKEQPGDVGPEDVTLPPYLPDTPGMRESLARHYNAIALMDAELGARLAELEESGVADDTIVFYYSDHGAALPRSKRYLYDEGLRVPLIVRVPEKWRHLLPYPPGSHVDTPVSLVDLVPSILAAAEIKPPVPFDGQPFLGSDRIERPVIFGGRDRMGERYDLTRTIRSRRYRYIRNYAPHRITGQYVAYEWIGQHYQDYELAKDAGTLNPLQTRFWQTKPAEELYDMLVDPSATSNLVDDPAHAEALAAHRTALDAYMLDIRDTGFIPEHSPLESWEASQDETLYPLKDVMALAALAITRDPDNLPGIVETLNHNSPIMRHWAAKGLLMLAIDGHALPETLADVCMNEHDIHARIPLAEALGHAGESARWVRVLTDIVKTAPDPRVKLQSLDALTWLPLFPDISLAVIEALHDDEDTYLRQASDYLSEKLRGTYHPRNRIFNLERLDGRSMMG